jgi:hypothetical protein
MKVLGDITNIYILGSHVDRYQKLVVPKMPSKDIDDFGYEVALYDKTVKVKQD